MASMIGIPTRSRIDKALILYSSCIGDGGKLSGKRGRTS